MKERKEEASKSGEDVIIDPLSPPSRHQRWKLGRQKDLWESHKMLHERLLLRSMSWSQTLESLGAHSQQPHVDLHTPDDYVTRISTKGSCADGVSGPSGGKIPLGDTSQFGFYVDERPPRIVSIGRVHRGDFTLHYAPLPAHLVKIVVDEAVDGSAEVPIHTEEVSSVREALGTFITWPKYLVVADFIKDIKRLEPLKKYACQDDPLSHRDDTMTELFGIAATFFSNPLHVPCDTTSSSCGVLHLSKFNVGTMDEDLYGYFDPQSTQNMRNKGDETAGYITLRMSDAKTDIPWTLPS
ncbi:hypothetical protein OROHE_011114 [Orobanche hederae]